MPYYEGSLNSRIALIGEALGESEVALGRPFAGAAGQKLDQLLAAACIPRSQCYITNVFDFKPAGNNIKPFLDIRRSSVFESEVYAVNAQRLKEELTKCKANVLVPLGSVPLYTLTGRVGIKSWRGSVLESTLLPGRKVIPTYHPSYIKRGAFLEGYIARLDLIKALEESSTPAISTPKYEFNLSPKADEAIEYIRHCATLHSPVSVDVEAVYSPGRSEITHCGIAPSANEAICIPFWSGGSPNYSMKEEAAIVRALAELLSNEHTPILGQNFMYDSYMFLWKYGIVCNNVLDTLIAQAIIYQELPRGLDFLCSIYSDQPYYKKDAKRYLGQKTEELRFREYNAIDCAVLHVIHKKQLEVLEYRKLMGYYKHKLALMHPLLAMQYKGIRMDKQALIELQEQAEAQLRDLKAHIDLKAGFPLNPRSHKQLCDYFYGKLGLKPYLKHGRPTCDSDAMIRLEHQHKQPTAKLINTYRSLATKNSTFYNMALEAPGRLRCSFSPVGGGSRLSSSKTIIGTGMNMQNQPPEMKYTMIADEGYVLVRMDLAQAENRVAAYIWHVRRMIEAFEQGVDLHRVTAGAIFKKPPEEISTEKGSTYLGGGKYSERDIGKRANHSFNYGLGIDNFALRTELKRSEAVIVHDGFFAAYPEIKLAHSRIEHDLRRTRVMTNPLGRSRILLEEFGQELFREGYAFVPQTTVGDHMNIKGLLWFYQNAPSEAVLLNQVHDSIEFEYPLLHSNGLVSAIEALKASLETPIEYEPGRSLVIPVDVAIGFNFGPASSKNPFGCMELSSAECKSKLVAICEEARQTLVRKEVCASWLSRN
jgi:uracil-DNA glycosylase family 4